MSTNKPDLSAGPVAGSTATVHDASAIAKYAAALRSSSLTDDEVAELAVAADTYRRGEQESLQRAGYVDADDMRGRMSPRLVRADTVRPRAVEWLWRDRMALGKITMLDGRPGLGKSSMALDIAARISDGRPMPDGFDPGLGPRHVILITGEDGWDDTLAPRLLAAKADLGRVNFRADLSIPATLAELEEDINAVRCVFVLIDPVVAFVPAKVNLYRDQDARTALRPLAEMAERTGAAILCLRHTSKATGIPAQDKGTGSVAIGGAARSNLIAGPDPDVDGRFALASIKNNLGPKPPSLGYRLETVMVPVDGGETDVGVIAWDGAVQLDADDLVGGERQGEASRFLEEMLAEGPMPSQQLKRTAESRGLSWTGAVRRASERLGVIKEPTAVGVKDSPWMWRLPDKPLNSHNSHNTAPELSTDLSVLSTPDARVTWTAADRGGVTVQGCSDYGAHQSDIVIREGVGICLRCQKGAA